MPTHYARAQAEGLRRGARLLVSGGVLLATWLGGALATFATLGRALDGAPDTVVPELALILAILSAIAAVGFAIGLLRGCRWRHRALGLWASCTAVTAVVGAIGADHAATALILAAGAVVVVGTLTWATLRFDPPAI